MKFMVELPVIHEDEMTPLAKELLDIISQCIQYINQQALEIQELRDEIARLKGNSPKPKIKPSGLDKDRDEEKNRREPNAVRRGSRKRRNKKGLYSLRA